MNVARTMCDDLRLKNYPLLSETPVYLGVLHLTWQPCPAGKPRERALPPAEAEKLWSHCVDLAVRPGPIQSPRQPCWTAPRHTAASSVSFSLWKGLSWVVQGGLEVLGSVCALRGNPQPGGMQVDSSDPCSSGCLRAPLGSVCGGGPFIRVPLPAAPAPLPASPAPWDKLMNLSPHLV